MDDLDEFILVSESQASEIIGMKVSTLRYWRITGEGPAFIKVGGRCVRYKLCDINEWIESRRYRSTAEFHDAKMS